MMPFVVAMVVCIILSGPYTSTNAILLPVKHIGKFEAEVTKVTTSSVTLEWSGADMVQISNGKTEQSFVAPQNATRFDDLTNGASYTFVVVNLDTMEGNTLNVTLASCPQGWLGQESSCFSASNSDKQNWRKAVEKCGNTPRAHLAHPQSSKENYFLTKVVPSSNVMYWIGVNETNGQNLTYSDGTPVLWTSLQQALPEGAESVCVAFISYKLTNANNFTTDWNPMDCGYNRDYICQYQVSDSPRKFNVEADSTRFHVSWDVPRSIHISMSDDIVFNLTTGNGEVVSSSRSTLARQSRWMFGVQPGRLYYLDGVAVHHLTSNEEVISGKYPATAFVTKPESPRYFNTIMEGPTFVELEWELPSERSQYSTFKLNFKLVESDLNETQLVASDDGEFVYEGEIVLDNQTTTGSITGLEPYTHYQIDIVAVSSQETANGIVSAESHVTTMNFRTLVAPPRNFRVTDLTETSFNLVWTQALGKVHGYLITIRSVSANEYSHSVVTNETSFLVEGLKPGWSYKAEIESVRHLEMSQSVVLYQTTRPYPVNVNHVHPGEVSSTSVAITIYNPSQRNGAIFDGFNLTFNAADPPMEVKYWRIPHNGSSISASDTVEGLTPGRTYHLTVYTTSGEVASVPVHPKSIIKTDLDSPSGFRFSERSETHVTLIWEPAKGGVDHYVILCDECEVAHNEVDPGTHTFRFDDLVPGKQYNFSLRVEHHKTKSNESPLVVRTEPNQPGQPTVIGRNTTAMTVKWSIPQDVLSDFRVRYEPYIADELILVSEPFSGDVILPATSFDDDSMLITISPLTPGLTYDVNVTTLSSNVESKSVTTRNGTDPAPVHELKTNEVGDTWAEVNWEAGAGGRIYYVCSLYDASSGYALLSKNEIQNNSFTIKLLEPATLYYFTVSTFSQTGLGREVDIYFQTRPLPPRDLKFNVVEESLFQVSWLLPLSAYYSFDLRLFRETPKGRSYVIDDVINTLKPTYTFDGLVPGGTYRVAVTTVYNSTSSYESVVETTLFPEHPLTANVTSVSATSINVTWQPPSGSIGGYMVEMTPSLGEMVLDGINAEFSLLTPGIRYEINVYTLSENGQVRSRHAAQVVTSTDESLPGPPTDLSLVSEEAGFITATWVAPANPNGNITYFAIQYRQIYPHPSVEFLSVDAKSTRYVISDVEHGANYYVKVAGVNGAGVGTFTSMESVKVRESTSGTVYDLKVTAHNSSSIVVSWQHPRKPNGDITRYLLTVTDPGQNFISEVDFSPKRGASPYACLLQTSSEEAISSLLELHASATIDHPQGPTQNSDVVLMASVDGDDLYVDGVLSTNEKVKVEPNVGSGLGLLQLTLFDDGDSAKSRRQRSVIINHVTAETTFEPLCPVTYTIGDLEPYTEYDVTVRVWTAVGEGLISNASVTTIQEAPEGPPVNIKVAAVYPSKFTISWSPPEKPNGVPWYNLVLTSEDESKDFATNETTFEFTNLQPYTAYGLKLFATTMEGRGPSTEQFVIATAQDNPGGVQDVKATVNGSRSAVITWLPPSRPNGVISGYMVYVLDVDRNVSTELVELPKDFYFTGIEAGLKNQSTPLGSLLVLRDNIDTTRLTKRLTDLHPFTNYVVEVAGQTSAGLGSFGTIWFKTDQDVPGSPPFNLTYSHLSSTSVNISWEEPLEPNGVITGYTVYISSGKLQSRKTNHRFAIVDKLEKYKPYTVYVRAHTVKGEGRDSSQNLDIHTDEDIPSTPPTNLTYENISSSAIRLSWIPPSVPNGIVLYYTVFYTNETGTFTANSTATEVILSRLRTYGNYNVTIRSTTSKGESKVASKVLGVLTMEGQPSTPPYQLSYVNVSSHSIIITWSRPVVPNGIIQFYNLILVDISGKYKNQSFATKDDYPNATIDFLLPYNVYQVTVSASTKYGDGDKVSLPMTIYTMQDVPGSTPLIVSYANVTSTSIRVTWSPPVITNGVITSYTMKYHKMDLDSNEPQMKVFPGNQSFAVLENLAIYTKYNLSLSASTIAGEGPAVFIAILTDEDFPTSLPFELVPYQLNSTAVRLEWKPPQEPNGIILGYEILYKSRADEKLITERTNETSITLTGLRKYGVYDVLVNAYNKIGLYQGKPHFTESFQTLEDAPSDPPHGVTVEAMSSTSIAISWLRPMTPNGKIRFYTVYYTLAGGETQEKQVYNGTATILTDLRKYALYDIQLAASTIKGDGGHRSDKKIARTLPDTPGPPFDVLCDAIGGKEINITWKVPRERNGIVIGYHVFVESIGILYNLTSDKFGFVLDGLQPYTLYDIDVRARTSIGLGEARMCRQRTAESVPSQPINITVTNVTATSALISWKTPLKPNGLILNYRIFYYSQNNHKPFNKSVHVQLPHQSVEIKLNDLMKFTQYEIQVVASTSVGPGQPSETVYLHTKPGVPDHSVIELKAIAETSKSLKISWRPHLPLTGPTYFRAAIYLHYNLNQLVNVQDNLSSSTVTFDGLQPFTTYVVQVVPLVTGEKGEGPPALVTITTLEDVPSTAVRALRYEQLSSTSVVMLWDSPEIPNGIIISYTVIVDEIGPKLVLTGNTTYVPIHDLEKFSNYTVRVTSATKIGAGPEAVISFRTLQDVPSDAPRDVQVDISSRNLTLAWQAPLTPNGIISNYTVSYSHKTSIEMVEVVTSPQVTLLNLNPFTIYELYIAATTKAGTGPGVLKTVRTKEDVPSEPSDLTCEAVSESEISLSWGKPVESNGIIVDYRVQYVKDGMEELKSKLSVDHLSKEVGRFTYTLDLLSAFTKYTVQVMANTKAGFGPSAVCVTKTGQGIPLAPEQTGVIEVSDTTIEIWWRSPSIVNGVLVSYDVTYTPPDSCMENQGFHENLTVCVIKTNTTVTSRTLSHLSKFTEYVINVAAQTGHGVGPPTSSFMQRTSVGKPDHPPRDIVAVAISSKSINITWDVPIVLTGPTSYKIKAVNQVINKVTDSPLLEPRVRDYVIDDLVPDTTYDITVKAVTSAGELESDPTSVRTNEGVPSFPPSDVTAEAVADNSSVAVLLFRPPLVPNGKITQYTIQHRLQHTQEIFEVIVSTEKLPGSLALKKTYSWPVGGLLGGRSYEFRVRASTIVGPGEYSLWTKPIVTPITGALLPPVVPETPPASSELMSIARTFSESTTLVVKSPCVFSDVNGPLASISVVVAEGEFTREPTDWYDAHSQDPSPPYKVVASLNPALDCPGVPQFQANNDNITKGGRKRRSLGDGGKHFVIGSDDSCDQEVKPFCNGPLKSNTDYRVKYRAETIEGDVTETGYSKPMRTKKNFLEAHFTLIVSIAAALGAFIVILVISICLIRRRMQKNKKYDGGIVSEFASGRSPPKGGGTIEETFEECKGPISESGAHSNRGFILETAHNDKVSEVAVSRPGLTRSGKKCERAPSPRAASPRNQQSKGQDLTSFRRPVPKRDFASHITRFMMNKNKSFSGEFDDIRGLPVTGTTMTADKQFNRAKNRHAKLVPYDHSRVKLEAIPAIEGSDYINASFIPGPQSTEQFIAAQTPLEHTKKDFWRMVWETGASCLVMLCNSAEEGKKRGCDYWPKKQTEYYGNLAVQMNHEETQLEWVIRHFTVTMRDKVRHVTQFHLITWPVLEQSDTAQAILRFVQTVRANRSNKSFPVVVMCSSGSGRTGVFIGLDRMLENLSMTQQVDVFGTVAALRRYRPYMVQTLGEYILMHRCIWEAINQKAVAGPQLRHTPTGDGMEETVF